jgi:predicted anti-sigma-YlaC factor YlaD
MHCQDVREQLQEYLDGQLPSTAAQDVDAHLKTCAVCRDELGLLRQVDDALATLPLLEESADFTARVMSQVRAAEVRPVFPVRREDVLVSFAFSWSITTTLLVLSWLRPRLLGVSTFLRPIGQTVQFELDGLWQMVRVEPIYLWWGVSILCMAAAAAAAAAVLTRQWSRRRLRWTWRT